MSRKKLKYRGSAVAAMVRMMSVVFVSLMFMAVSCPEPDPGPDPKPIDPGEEIKSAERKSFETSVAEGLYLKGGSVLLYEDGSFQRAVNAGRKTYRIQRDDQTEYLHIAYSDNVPSSVKDEAVCTVYYNIGGGGETMLIVKFVTVHAENGKLWLWNELQKVGVIVPKL